MRKNVIEQLIESPGLRLAVAGAILGGIAVGEIVGTFLGQATSGLEQVGMDLFFVSAGLTTVEIGFHGIFPQEPQSK